MSRALPSAPLRLFALLAAMLAVTTSCAPPPRPPISAAPAVAAGTDRLAPGDRLRIDVFGERDLSGEFVVGSNGTVTMPLVGPVPASGATAQQLRDRLVTAYTGGFLKSPQIVVEVISSRPFYIFGEVNRPGEYATTPGLTIAGAIAKAAGYSYRANHKKVYIRRGENETEYEADPNKPERVLPGDIIRIGERHF